MIVCFLAGNVGGRDGGLFEPGRNQPMDDVVMLGASPTA
jgi:hypothetical protein